MVSVIIPVYNSIKYLDDCVYSIVKQSVNDWECILVDDGSTDGSGQKCDEWKKKDERIRVIHQQNGGVSKARNRGIEEAKGDFIVFVDSDDWVSEDYLAALINATKAELVVSGIRQVKANGNDVNYKPSCRKTFNLDKDGIEEIVDLNRKFLLYGPVVKLYLASIIKRNNITFPLGCNYGEDLQFNLLYLEHVHSITSVDDICYFYRCGTETLSTKKRPNQFEQDYAQWLKLKAFYSKRGMWQKPIQEMLYERLWGIVYDGIFNSPKSNKEILSIPEIDDLKDYRHVFRCSKWIKWGILYRKTFVFRLKL